MTSILVAALLSACLAQSPAAAMPAAAPAPAGLRATIHLAFARVDVDASAPVSPYAGFGPLVARMMTPDGAADIQYTVTPDAMRADIDGRLGPLPRGTIVIQAVGDPSMRVLNPGNKTWYEIPAGQNLGTILGTPDIDLQPAHERATIAGRQADRYRLSETLHLPVPEGVNLPQGFPRELAFTGDVWFTDALAGANYRAITKALQAFAAIPGIDALTADGRFPLRLTLRSDVIPGFEIRTEVTSLTTMTPSASAFEVPSDYQKVQPPFGGGVQ